MNKREKLIFEINAVIAPKLFNIEHKTATEREIQVVRECLGFLSLLNFSILSVKEVKKIWETSEVRFQ